MTVDRALFRPDQVQPGAKLFRISPELLLRVLPDGAVELQNEDPGSKGRGDVVQIERCDLRTASAALAVAAEIIGR